MSDEAGEEPQAAKEITFNVKSSGETKYVMTVPESITVLELKTKLSTTEYADLEPARQRLIYSGRVLKDADALSVYKIKDGNTIHMVRGAASNQRQNPTSSGSAVPPGAGVPTNLATGTGTDPLAGLTGARYAGFAQMPGAEQFGPDGGMGPPQGPDEMLRMLENPMFQSQMNEAMNNPHVIQMMQNSPMIRNNPWLRQMLENPEMRRTMMDPQFIRQSMQMSRMMGMGGPGGQASMPAPGVTDTTPQPAREGTAAAGGGASTNPSQTGTAGTQTTSPPPNPFLSFAQPNTGAAGSGNQANPFAALFGGGGGGGMAGPFGTAAAPAPAPGSNPTSPPPPPEGQTRNQQQPQQPNPFAGMFGGAAGNQQQNPMAQMAQQMMQNPEMFRMAMQGMGLGGDGQGAGQGGMNPFAMFGGGLGTGGMNSPTPQPQDNRPPEEQYADQLRQLNDMGFHEFERNVRALRMAGGSVQGAIENLLGGT